MVEVTNREQAILFLEHVLNYIAAYRGATWAHHIITLKRDELILEQSLTKGTL